MKANININNLEETSTYLSIVEGLEQALSDSLDMLFSHVPDEKEEHLKTVDIYLTFYELRRDQNKIFSLTAATTDVLKRVHKTLDTEINNYYIE